MADLWCGDGPGLRRRGLALEAAYLSPLGGRAAATSYGAEKATSGCPVLFAAPSCISLPVGWRGRAGSKSTFAGTLQRECRAEPISSPRARPASMPALAHTAFTSSPPSGVGTPKTARVRDFGAHHTVLVLRKMLTQPRDDHERLRRSGTGSLRVAIPTSPTLLTCRPGRGLALFCGSLKYCTVSWCRTNVPACRAVSAAFSPGWQLALSTRRRPRCPTIRASRTPVNRRLVAAVVPIIICPHHSIICSSLGSGTRCAWTTVSSEQSIAPARHALQHGPNMVVPLAVVTRSARPAHVRSGSNAP